MVVRAIFGRDIRNSRGPLDSNRRHARRGLDRRQGRVTDRVVIGASLHGVSRSAVQCPSLHATGGLDLCNSSIIGRHFGAYTRQRVNILNLSLHQQCILIDGAVNMYWYQLPTTKLRFEQHRQDTFAQ